GTAPGFRVDHHDIPLFFLPGVPREMRPMYETWVDPVVLAQADGQGLVRHVIRMVGISEAVLEQRVAPFRAEPGLRLGFRAAYPENQLKLLFTAEVPERRRKALVEQVCDAIGPRVYGVDSGDLAEVVGGLLAERGETIALAESCTVGKVVAWLGGVPGASRYLLEGAVVYSNEAKTRVCGVSPDLIVQHGAVSEEVARVLSSGIRARAATTWGIGITGIAGPSGGSAHKPVGTVHVAINGPGIDYHRCLQLRGGRDRITTMAAATALSMLRQFLVDGQRTSNG
ncbi:MAG: nicotinamide-nucleotide amidohydrolase family protein, partial [Myxococcota bacterium]|nr:nicotinamide-nucleotide amidohydrolase family protein [Myxococcota bacterium]